MDLEKLKDLGFRHCEKVAFAVVALFVLLNVRSHFSGESASSKLDDSRARGGRPPEEHRGIEAHRYRIVSPFADVPTPIAPTYNPMNPPIVNHLEAVQLQEKNPNALEATRPIPGELDGELTEEKPTAADLQLVSAELARADPCEFDKFVDEKAKEIKFVVKKAGSPRALRGMLKSRDSIRVVVYVLPEKYEPPEVVPKPEIVTAAESRQALGVVVIRFRLVRPTKEKDALTKWLEPTRCVLYRQGEGEKERRQIDEVTAPTTEGPQAPGSPVPRPAAKSPAEAKGFWGDPEKQPGLTPAGTSPEDKGGPALPRFADRNVESESTYTYWVRAIVDEEGKPPRSAESEPKVCKTFQRFTLIAYGGSDRMAMIAVIIGPKERGEGDPPLVEGDSIRFFKVPIGGLIGDLPGAAEAPVKHPGAAKGAQPKGAQPKGAHPAPPPKAVEEPKEPKERKEPKGEPGASPAAAEAGSRYVTKSVLVDILPDTFRLTRKTTEELVPDSEGKLTRQKVETLRGELARQVLVRDRKNRLVGLWNERLPSYTPSK